MLAHRRLYVCEYNVWGIIPACSGCNAGCALEHHARMFGKLCLSACSFGYATQLELAKTYFLAEDACTQEVVCEYNVRGIILACSGCNAGCALEHHARMFGKLCLSACSFGYATQLKLAKACFLAEDACTQEVVCEYNVRGIILACSGCNAGCILEHHARLFGKLCLSACSFGYATQLKLAKACFLAEDACTQEVVCEYNVRGIILACSGCNAGCILEHHARMFGKLCLSARSFGYATQLKLAKACFLAEDACTQEVVCEYNVRGIILACSGCNAGCILEHHARMFGKLCLSARSFGYATQLKLAKAYFLANAGCILEHHARMFGKLCLSARSFGYATQLELAKTYFLAEDACTQEVVCEYNIRGIILACSGCNAGCALEHHAAMVDKHDVWQAFADRLLCFARDSFAGSGAFLQRNMKELQCTDSRMSDQCGGRWDERGTKPLWADSYFEVYRYCVYMFWYFWISSIQNISVFNWGLSLQHLTTMWIPIYHITSVLYTGTTFWVSKTAQRIQSKGFSTWINIHHHEQESYGFPIHGHMMAYEHMKTPMNWRPCPFVGRQTM